MQESPSEVNLEALANERAPGVASAPEEDEPSSSGNAVDPGESGDIEPLSPGVLVVQVLRGSTPVTTGRVILAPAKEHNKDPWIQPAAGAGVEQGLDQEGRARFFGVSPGKYTVNVSLGARHLRQVLVDVDDAQGKRVRIQLGDARISGHVYDERGYGQARVLVTWSHRGSSDAGFWSHTWTRDDGSYELQHLLAGPAWLNAELGLEEGNIYSASQTLMHQVVLQPGESLVHDFGSATGTRTLRVCYTTRDGDRVHSQRTLHFRQPANGEYFQHRFARGQDVDEVQLLPGLWKVSVDNPLKVGQRTELGSLEVEDRDLSIELTLPGSTVSGTLDVTGWEGPLEGRAWVSIRGPDDDYVFWSATWTGARTWTINGVENGDWVLQAGTRTLTTTTPIRVQDRSFEVDLVVAP